MLNKIFWSEKLKQVSFLCTWKMNTSFSVSSFPSFFSFISPVLARTTVFVYSVSLFFQAMIVFLVLILIHASNYPSTTVYQLPAESTHLQLIVFLFGILLFTISLLGLVGVTRENRHLPMAIFAALNLIFLLPFFVFTWQQLNFKRPALGNLFSGVLAQMAAIRCLIDLSTKRNKKSQEKVEMTEEKEKE